MPIHDWTRVKAGILHAFHLEWISSLTRALNGGLLPEEYYALPEQFAFRFGPEGEAIDVPLESTYQAAFTGIPARWRKVLEAAS